MIMTAGPGGGFFLINIIMELAVRTLQGTLQITVPDGDTTVDGLKMLLQNARDTAPERQNLVGVLEVNIGIRS